MGRKSVHLDQIKRKVVPSVFRFEIKMGHLKWKISDLARASGVNRSSIYYHLGRTKEQILERSITHFSEDTYNLGRKRKLTADEFLPMIVDARKAISQNGDAKAFYFHWVFQGNSKFRSLLARFERAYRERLKLNFPALSASELLEMRLLIHGIVLMPFLSDKDIEEILARKLGG